MGSLKSFSIPTPGSGCHDSRDLRKSQIAATDLGEDYRLDPQYYDPAYLQIKAPEGYYETTIGDIGEIRGGVSIPREHRRELPEDNSVPYFQVRHILTDGHASGNLLWISQDIANENKNKKALPGDILVTVAGTVGKVMIVPVDFPEGVLFDTSIRRIRITDESVNPEAVLEFLKSDLGQLQFRRLTGGTAIPQITTPILASMRVFLPREREFETSTSEPSPPEISANVTQATVIADVIQSQLVDYLRSVNAEDNTWRETFEQSLRSIAASFLTKTLEETVIQDFPAPIAIPYRRLLMARYNYYERLDRMVSLVESCIYLVYHVLISDYCRHSWQQEVILSSEARQAMRGRQSIDYRLKFIAEVLDAAKQGAVSLFVPELVNSRIVEVGDLFREEVRNPIAHSAPGSEPYVKSLVDKYFPHIEDLLKSIRFLDQYTVCRIRNHYYENGQWSYQAEVYRGAEYDFNIQESNSAVILNEDGPRLIEAERDHLVLLSADNDILDLHPFYQLYFGSETCRESHLCFFKYRQGQRLLGESIRSSVEVHLPGIEVFQALTGLNVPPDGQT